MEEEIQQQHKEHVQLLKARQENVEVPKSFYKNHRDLLVRNIREKLNPPKNSIMFFVGVPTIPINDTDCDYWVDQDSNFTYLFGVEEPDCLAAIEVDTGKTTLFPDQIPLEYKMWMTVKEEQYYKETYEVEQSVYSNKISEFIKELNPSTVFLYDGIDSDSGLRPKLPELKMFGDVEVNKEELYAILNEQRTIKDEKELELMRFITSITADAHIQVMQNVIPGIKEQQMEALYKFHVEERCGGRNQSYNCICASGIGNATLHYNENDKIVGDSQLILNDMGSRYKGYCSDVTCTFPSNGKFTQKQKEIYEAVLDANLSVFKALKAGVEWDKMHELAEYRTLEHLQKLGIVIPNVPVQEMVDARVGAIFQPHGLGHFIGGRVHDVGGYNTGCPPRHAKPGLKSLRTRRTMKAGNVVTIEPGCYFIAHILEQAFKDENLAKYLVKEKIDEYRHVGGVRIEDDIIVYENHSENMSIVPRTVEEIELCMAKKPWRK